ncbi:hypothetical protein AB0A73_13970 [Glycomyces sp. NPDC047369]
MVPSTFSADQSAPVRAEFSEILLKPTVDRLASVRPDAAVHVSRFKLAGICDVFATFASVGGIVPTMLRTAIPGKLIGLTYVWAMSTPASGTLADGVCGPTPGGAGGAGFSAAAGTIGAS